MKRFDNKVILITGASSGIGAALAREFARRGAHLVLGARREDRLRALADELEPKGTQVLVQRCDVTDPEDLHNLVEAAREKFGRLDGVVANAGYPAIGTFEKLTLEDIRRQLETNLFGVLYTIKATLEDLKKSHGTLALMGSVSGHISTPQSSAYAMSKFAVRALAESLYAELAPYSIKVVLISPGFVESEIHKWDRHGNLNEARRNQVPKWLKMPTAKAARKIANAIARGQRERVLTGHGKLFYYFHRFFPGLMARFFRRAVLNASKKHRNRKPHEE